MALSLCSRTLRSRPNRANRSTSACPGHFTLPQVACGRPGGDRYIAFAGGPKSCLDPEEDVLASDGGQEPQIGTTEHPVCLLTDLLQITASIDQPRSHYRKRLDIKDVVLKPQNLFLLGRELVVGQYPFLFQFS